MKSPKQRKLKTSLDDIELECCRLSSMGELQHLVSGEEVDHCFCFVSLFGWLRIPITTNTHSKETGLMSEETGSTIKNKIFAKRVVDKRFQLRRIFHPTKRLLQYTDSAIRGTDR